MTDRKALYSPTDIDGRTFYHGIKVELEVGDELSGRYMSN